MMRLERAARKAESAERDEAVRLERTGSDGSFGSLGSAAGEERCGYGGGGSGGGGSGGAGGSDPGGADEGKPGGGSRQQQPLASLALVSFPSAAEEERSREIERIQSSVVQIGEVYADVADLVDSQQVEIDDIEQNIMRTHATTEAGVAQLVMATASQKSAGTWFRCVMLVVLVACFVAVGVLYGPQIVGNG